MVKICKSSLDEQFSRVVCRIATLAYAPWRSVEIRTKKPSLDAYINNEHNAEFGDFWHGRLGNVISNWYFFARDQEPELQRIHKHHLCSLNPSWAKDVLPDAAHPRRFNWVPYGDERRSVVQDEIDSSLGQDNKFSINIAHRLFKTGDLWRSETEKTNHWLLVELGELLLYCFEWRLLKEFTAAGLSFQDATITQRGSMEHYADEAWKAVVDRFGQGDSPRELQTTANRWLKRVLRNEVSSEATLGEYDDWWKRQQDWYILAEDAINLSSYNLENLSPRDWGQRICEYSIDPSPQESLDNMPKRVRFSPAAEEYHGTRNLLVLPLWVDEFSEPPSPALETEMEKEPILRSPFTAYVIATFYDSSVLIQHGEMVRALLSILAEPDTMRFAGEAMSLREKTENIRFYGRGLTHDLNHCIEGLRMNFGSLRRTSKKKSSVHSIVEQAEKTLTLIEYIAGDYRDYSYGSDLVDLLKLQPLHIGRLIDDAVEIFSPSPELSILNRVESDCVVLVDKHRLLRVILNLFKNSKEAMRLLENCHITVTAAPSAKGIFLDISDEGEGIPPTEWNRVFSPTFTTKQPSRIRGMGLSVSRIIMKAHFVKTGVGSIFVKNSQPHRGTTFRLELPLPHEAEGGS